MEKKNPAEGALASPAWDPLESFARQEIQGFLQRLLEEEATDLLGRGESHRRPVGATPGYHNGYGKPRRLTLSGGMITLWRPRVRGLEERFVSRVLPLFQRWTAAVGALLPELYLHGLALGSLFSAYCDQGDSFARSFSCWEVFRKDMETQGAHPLPTTGLQTAV